MKHTFPLIRVKWSNEHVMAGLFLVLLLYHIPEWIEKPSRMGGFLLLVISAVALDALLTILRHKQLWCCVSGAVTASIISVLTPDIPLWAQLIGVISALILGKHIWGGTGQNPINPAIVGILVIHLMSRISDPVFSDTYLLLPAMILSLLFLCVRPFAGTGFLLGMIVALLLNHEFGIQALLVNGVFFWSCIVVTDPVTITGRPAIGSVSGFLVGFLAVFLNPHPVTLGIGVLCMNLLSYIMDTQDINMSPFTKMRLKIPKVFTCEQEQFLDLTGEPSSIQKSEVKEFTPEKLIQIIKEQEVFGMGGAAFSTARKLQTVHEAKVDQKHLIINAVECDPGLLHDHYLLRHYMDEINVAAHILKEAIGLTSIRMAVKEAEDVKQTEGITLCKVPDRYPIGAERILINELLGVKLGQNQLPARNGILVLNVQTVYSIYEAVCLGKKADTRFLTVANLKTKSAKVVKVRLGMALREVMDAVYPGVLNLFAGGGIMQAYTAEDTAIIDKNVNFIATGAYPQYKESPQCSKCERCVVNCPAGLKVNKIVQLVDAGKIKETVKYSVSDCIGCGSCSFSCLAGRNLSARVAIAKEALK
ncbi:RnfABCDGE type electron transport complex subunit D [Lachnospiraceae bacterium MD1]|uniref:RnfABCDGE type electron transport complex subunit D n=1 Tax=Variimorphobacter saccharofermentans TaxID=2755051 RepID=A0A839K3C6_9FIRM|nr:RnfABCDGE type electron transport complex subunit D [Variimorphobacter saccharofermentans]MBB2184413.1 RnfABCDGE type electron transport complex subunit D [Variimorphobacter saccharofermentans]